MQNVPGFSIDLVARAAGADPNVLRLENLDTDLRPPQCAIVATRAAIESDDSNSYLPFVGRMDLREAIADHVSRLSGVTYEAGLNVVVTAGGTAGMLNVLLALLEPGDEVLLTDPTYAGMIYRVSLAGGLPVLVPLLDTGGEWRLDLQALKDAISPRTRALFIMNPSIPSGAVLNDDEWEEIARICIGRGIWLIYNAAMERILFDGRSYRHPASLPGMSDWTITIGSVSKEYRMIGWRVGWVVGPKRLMDSVGLVSIYNVVTPVGIAQAGAAAALREDSTGLRSSIDVWEKRRNVVVEELAHYKVVPAAGGWSMLLDVGTLGLSAGDASSRLLSEGRVAATPMTHWGDRNGDRFVRLVFSNETAERLKGLGDRVGRSLPL